MNLTQITSAANGVSNLLLAIPQVAGLFSGGQGYKPNIPSSGTNFLRSILNGPPALVFHYEGEQTATLESDITDHFVEDNTSIQDQIALRPEMVTTHGFIGELNDVLPPQLAALKVIASKLTTVSGYVPGLSVTALTALNNAIYLYETAQNSLTSVLSAVGTFTAGESIIGSDGLTPKFTPNSPNSLLNTSTQTKQQQYFTQFYGYWRSRTLFTIQTPWAIFDSMAIKSLRAIQDADTSEISDFEITFKMIRFASILSSAEGFVVDGRLNNQILASNPTPLSSANPQGVEVPLFV